MNAIKAHLRALAASCAANEMAVPVMYSILAEHGKTFTPGGVLPSYMTAKRCYANCFERAMSDSRYAYAEGLGICAAIGTPIPLSHAWLVNGKEQAHDPTWGDMKGNLYVGVQFTNEFLLDFTEKTKMASVFESLYALRMSPEECRAYVVTGIAK